MSVVSPGAPEDDTGTRHAGPGHLLRSARESAGMGVRDVSAQLRLDERTVAALESDDFEGLPAPTFVRGYLRGYARLLGVPVGPVMEAYDREGFTPPDLVADIAETPDASTRDFPVRLATAGVVAVLVVLVVLWWNNQAFNELPAPVAAPEPAPGPAVAGPDAPPAPDPSPLPDMPDPALALQGGEGSRDESPAPPTAVTAPAVASEPAATGADTASAAPDTVPGAETVPAVAAVSASPAPAPGAAGAEESAADRAIARAEDVLERTRSEVDAIVASPADTPPDAAPASTGSTPAAEAAASDAGSGSAAASGDAHLVIRFPIEAWVEIHDRDDRRLFYNLAKPGRVVDVRGKPPIRLLLGRTRGVKVEFNGEAVDLAPHTERGVARLTLGG